MRGLEFGKVPDGQPDRVPSLKDAAYSRRDDRILQDRAFGKQFFGELHHFSPLRKAVAGSYTSADYFIGRHVVPPARSRGHRLCFLERLRSFLNGRQLSTGYDF